MKKIFILLLAPIISIAQISTTNITLKKGNEIYMMGDSQTANGGYGTQLISLLGKSWNAVNYGIPGNTTTQMAARITGITKGDANSVIILGGANDLIAATPSTVIIQNLRSMVNAIKLAKPTAKVILMTTTPFGGNVGYSLTKQAIQDTLNAAILSGTVILNTDGRLNIFTLLGGGTNTLLPQYDSGDHLHWSAAGQTAVGNYIYANQGFTLATVTPTLEISATYTRSFSQNLTPNSQPAFAGMYLNDSLKMGSNVIGCGPINSVSSITATSLFSSLNSTVTGILYSFNNVQVGPAGSGGSITNGGTSFKLLPGSSFPDMRFCTPSATNGRMGINNTSGNVLVGDVASMTDDGSTNLQVMTGISVPTLALKSNAGSQTSILNFIPYASNNSVINFMQSNGTVRGFIDMNTGSGAFRIFGSAGGYYLALGSNGNEVARFPTTGNLLINTTTDVPSSKLTIASTTQGVLFPRMTTTQKNAISSPATGLVVYDTTLNKLSVYTGSAWETVSSL